MNTKEVKFVANPTQLRFIQSRARGAIFSGRMREGKSAALVWSIFYHTVRNPGAHWILLRDTWTNLERTTLQEFFKWFPPGIYGEYKAEPKRFTWKCAVEGQPVEGDVKFMGLDDPGDASKLQSMTLAGVAMDEVSPGLNVGGISEGVFDMALTRLSQPDMNWVGARLAENFPDESYWTYARFVDPGTEGFLVYQAETPENEHNIFPGYYQQLAKDLAHRPDLYKRFVTGNYGFTQTGAAVTPQWRDHIHLARGLRPIRGIPLTLCWDFGLNPTCVITQATPLGRWNALWCQVGTEMGVQEYIERLLIPVLQVDYTNFQLQHIGDPAGRQREQSSSKQSAVKVIHAMLGGGFRPGIVSSFERVQALQALLMRHDMLQVDRERAKPIWHALRGGWHRHKTAMGVVGEIVKDMYSHPGDALSYGASILFPAQKVGKGKPASSVPAGRGLGIGITVSTRRQNIPAEARVLAEQKRALW